MSKPILTIGIPTYNRPHNITRTIHSLLPQLNDKVELLVRDNCSEIPVETLFTEDEKSKFRIIRTRTNIGGDANICGCIYSADTKWVWTLGDDSYPLPNAVETILSFIEKYPEEVMFCYNSYMQRETHSFIDLAEVNGYRSMFSNFLFISTSVFNREKLLNYLEYYYKDCTSMVGQTIFVLKYIEDNDGEIFFRSEHVVESTVDFFQKKVRKSKKEIEGQSWSREVFIRRSSLIFDEFSNKKKFLKKNLFKGIVQQYLGDILVHDGMRFKTRIELFRLVGQKTGYFNILRYNYPTIIQFFIKAVTPKTLYQKILSRAKDREIKNNTKDNV